MCDAIASVVVREFTLNSPANVGLVVPAQPVVATPSNRAVPMDTFQKRPQKARHPKSGAARPAAHRWLNYFHRYYSRSPVADIKDAPSMSRLVGHHAI
jgi:hypothetical protein